MTDVIKMPVHTLDVELQEKITASDKCIRQDWPNVRKMSMGIGWDGWLIEKHADRGSWRFLGFEHQHDYRIAVGIGRSNWYRLLAIAERFENLDKELFLSMSIENADRLSRQAEEIRYKPENIQAAATMSIRDFADLIVTEEEHGQGRPEHEKWVDFTRRMKDEQRVVIERGLGEWRREHGIDNDAYALELLVMEYTERPTLAGFLLDSIHNLTSEVREEKDPEKLRTLLAAHIQAMGEVLTACCGKEEDEAAA